MSDQFLTPLSSTNGESPIFDEHLGQLMRTREKRLEMERKLVEAAYLKQEYEQVVDDLGIRSEPELLGTFERVLDERTIETGQFATTGRHVDAIYRAPGSEEVLVKRHIDLIKRAGTNIAYKRANFVQTDYLDKNVRVLGFLRPRRHPKVRDLIRQESQIGARLIPSSPNEIVVRQEFFNEDVYTWFWHRELVEEGGSTREETVRYDVKDDRIEKHSNRVELLVGEELSSFAWTVQFYHDQVMTELYHVNPKTGEKFL